MSQKFINTDATSNYTYAYCLIMSADIRIQEIQNLIFSTEGILDRDISNKIITRDLINNFDNLSKGLDLLSQKSFDTFQNDIMDQMITFGSLNTAKEVCFNIKEHLETAWARNENPISAERVKNGNYLMLFHFIIESMKSVFNKNEVDEESFTTLNESIKNLISISERDNIYIENVIKLSSQGSEEIFVKIFSETDKLLSRF